MKRVVINHLVIAAIAFSVAFTSCKGKGSGNVKLLEGVTTEDTSDCDEKVSVSSAIFTDPRDGKTYKTVIIGKQVWMAENLNYAAEGSKFYDNKPENAEKYGRLYVWDMNVCPEGWHLPTREEWEELYATIGGFEVAAKKLKATSGWDNYKDWETGEEKSGNGTDDYGFAALPGGVGTEDGRFLYEDFARWWGDGIGTTGSEGQGQYAFTITPSGSYFDYYEDALYSVRCVCDERQ